MSCHVQRLLRNEQGWGHSSFNVCSVASELMDTFSLSLSPRCVTRINEAQLSHSQFQIERTSQKREARDGGGGGENNNRGRFLELSLGYPLDHSPAPSHSLN